MWKSGKKEMKIKCIPYNVSILPLTIEVKFLTIAICFYVHLVYYSAFVQTLKS